MTTIHIHYESMLYRLKSPLFLLLLVLFLLSFLASCGSMMEIASTPTSSAVTIDGNDADWEGKTWYVKDKNASVGFQHNGDMLYVFLKTGERSTQMQIMRGGLTVWLDPEAGSDEYMGIRYPMRPQGGPGEGALSGRDTQDGRDPMNAEDSRRIAMDAVRECEIIGPGEDALRIAPLHEGSIDAKFSMKSGVLIYELQIPLNDAQYHFPAAGPEGVGIGFATMTKDRDRQETARDRMERPESGGMGQRPGGGMQGGMPGGMGRPSGTQMMMREGASALELWIKVKM